MGCLWNLRGGSWLCRRTSHALHHCFNYLYKESRVYRLWGRTSWNGWWLCFWSFLLLCCNWGYSLCLVIYGSQPISLILLTSRTSGTTLSVAMLVIWAACGICVVGVDCVAEPAMPSITALTICTRSPASTYCGGTPVGMVDGCASDPSCCSAATGGTPSIWLGLPPSPATAASPCKVPGGIIGAWDAVSSKGSSSCQP